MEYAEIGIIGGSYHDLEGLEGPRPPAEDRSRRRKS
jgi:hypothetical protein